jgi:hypothetical protein
MPRRPYYLEIPLAFTEHLRQTAMPARIVKLAVYLAELAFSQPQHSRRPDRHERRRALARAQLRGDATNAPARSASAGARRLDSIEVGRGRLAKITITPTGLLTRPGRVTDLSDLAEAQSDSAGRPNPPGEPRRSTLPDPPRPIWAGTYEGAGEDEIESEDEGEEPDPSLVNEELTRAGWVNSQRQAARRDPGRALAWVRHAASVIGVDNPAAWSYRMFTSGMWPATAGGPHLWPGQRLRCRQNVRLGGRRCSERIPGQLASAERASDRSPPRAASSSRHKRAICCETASRGTRYGRGGVVTAWQIARSNGITVPLAWLPSVARIAATSRPVSVFVADVSASIFASHSFVPRACTFSAFSCVTTWPRFAAGAALAASGSRGRR